MTAHPFQGSKVELRPLEPAVLDPFSELLNRPELTGRRYLPDEIPEDQPLSRAAVEKAISIWGEKRDRLRLGVFRAGADSLLGHAGADWGWDPHNPSLYVVIDPRHQRQGYGTQAVRLLLTYLLESTVAHCLTTWIADWNAPGLEFAASLGFKHAGRMRRAGRRKGTFFDYVVMDMLRTEAHAD